MASSPSNGGGSEALAVATASQAHQRIAGNRWKKRIMRLAGFNAQHTERMRREGVIEARSGNAPISLGGGDFAGVIQGVHVGGIGALEHERPGARFDAGRAGEGDEGAGDGAW